MQPLTPWARVRAVLLAVAIGVSAVDATPLSQPPTRKMLADAALQEELERLREMSAAVGHPMTMTQAEDLVLDVTGDYADARSVVLKPYRPVRKFLGIGQAWGFFGYPETFPYWIVVEGRTADDAPWETLYEPRSSEHTLLRSKLRYRRLQFMFVDVPRRGRPKEITSRLADRIAPLAFEEMPELTAVRVYIRRGRTPPPGKQATKPPKKQWIQVRKP